MTTILRDLMLVCRNGHVITDRLKARPDLRLPRCDTIFRVFRGRSCCAGHESSTPLAPKKALGLWLKTD